MSRGLEHAVLGIMFAVICGMAVGIARQNAAREAACSQLYDPDRMEAALNGFRTATAMADGCHVAAMQRDATILCDALDAIVAIEASSYNSLILATERDLFERHGLPLHVTPGEPAP